MAVAPVEVKKNVNMVWEIENKGQRRFIIGVEEHVSGGKEVLGGSNEVRCIAIEPESVTQVTESCGKKLSEGWVKEIRVIRKFNRKG